MTRAIERRPKVGRCYLMRNGEPCGPIEAWNPVLITAPMTPKGAAIEGHPPHHTFDMAGYSTWQPDFDLVVELAPKRPKRKARK